MPTVKAMYATLSNATDARRQKAKGRKRPTEKEGKPAQPWKQFTNRQIHTLCSTMTV